MDDEPLPLPPAMKDLSIFVDAPPVSGNGTSSSGNNQSARTVAMSNSEDTSDEFDFF